MIDFGVPINGKQHLAEPRTQAQADKALNMPLSLGYRPNIPVFNMWMRGASWAVWTMLYDIEEMKHHAAILHPYDYYKSGIAAVQFEVKAKSSEDGDFATKTLQKFWSNSLDTAQHCYDYGWLGAEIMYREEKGYKKFDTLHGFHPLDVWAMTRKRHYAGFTVQNIQGNNQVGHGTGQLMLWGPRSWPAKGFWLRHRPEFNRFYGKSQLFAAWRPYKRLASRDGVEEIIDMALYRFGYRGPEIRFPSKSFMKTDGSGMDYEAARDRAREFAEMAKTGVSYGLPNDRDGQGEYDWQINFPEHTLSVDGLQNAVDALIVECSKGCGVAPELLEAAETGSGFSGRKIPMIGFYTGQLKNARNIVHGVKWQIINPLLRWNRGPGHDVEIECKIPILDSLLATEQPQQVNGGGPGAPPPQGTVQPTGGDNQPIPYTGPRGGKGQVDPNTGEVIYMSLESEFGAQFTTTVRKKRRRGKPCEVTLDLGDTPNAPAKPAARPIPEHSRLAFAATQTANAATQKANSSKLRVDHAQAQAEHSISKSAHHQAAHTARAKGLTDLAAKHERLRDAHGVTSAAHDRRAMTPERAAAQKKQLERGQKPLRAGFEGVKDERSNPNVNAAVAAARADRLKREAAKRGGKLSLDDDFSIEELLADPSLITPSTMLKASQRLATMPAVEAGAILNQFQGAI